MLPGELYLSKAHSAFSNNFHEQGKLSLAKAKKSAKQRCDQLELICLSKALQTGKDPNFEVSFPAKTHEDGCLFRVIITEKGTWQRAQAGFLLCHLSKLSVIDPYIVSGSQDVEFCQARSSTIPTGFRLTYNTFFTPCHMEGCSMLFATA